MKYTKKVKKEWELPELWRPELRNLEKRLGKSTKWVEKNKSEIHPSISWIQSIQLHDMGIDVTQLLK